MIAAAEALSLPFSIEAEMSVVGGMQFAPERIPEVLAKVQSGDFHREIHRRLFEAMVALWERKAPCDPVTLLEELKISGTLEGLGGRDYVGSYLGELYDACPTAANIEYHASIVASYAARRRLMEVGDKIVHLGRTVTDEPPERLQAEAERILAAVSVKLSGDGLVSAKSLLSAEMERLENMITSTTPLGIATGLSSVDEKLGPMEPGDLVVIAARPSMGKSALAVNNLAADAAIRQRYNTAIFSIETPKGKVINRLLASEGRVNMARAKRLRKFQDHEYPQMAQASSLIGSAPLTIDHTPGLTLDQMRVALRKQQRERGKVDLVLVDYLQMMTDPRSKSRYDEVSRISGGLKRIAQEFECVMVALSQLSRAVEQRPSKEPMMSDLRESGQLEQDADVIILLFRPEYYFGPTVKVGTGAKATDQNVEGKAEIILGKVRDGATGKVTTIFEKEFTLFRDYR